MQDLKNYLELKAQYKTGEKLLKSKNRLRKHLAMNPTINNSRIIQLDVEIGLLEEELEDCKERIDKIESTLSNLYNNLDNLEYNVFYLKHVKSYSLKRISKKTHYSLSHIKRISAKLKREHDV